MLVLRTIKGAPLTAAEMDNNFIELYNRIDLSSDQTISELKTFNLSPVAKNENIPNSSELATKKYIDSFKENNNTLKVIYSEEYPPTNSNPNNYDFWGIVINKKLQKYLTFKNGSWS